MRRRSRRFGGSRNSGDDARVAATMLEETGPHCGEAFVVLDSDDRQEVIRRDEAGGVWRVVFSCSWLARRCQITDPSSH
jgi:hypothetical protein